MWKRWAFERLSTSYGLQNYTKNLNWQTFYRKNWGKTVFLLSFWHKSMNCDNKCKDYTCAQTPNNLLPSPLYKIYEEGSGPSLSSPWDRGRPRPPLIAGALACRGLRSGAPALPSETSNYRIKILGAMYSFEYKFQESFKNVYKGTNTWRFVGATRVFLTESIRLFFFILASTDFFCIFATELVKIDNLRMISGNPKFRSTLV